MRVQKSVIGGYFWKLSILEWWYRCYYICKVLPYTKICDEYTIRMHTIFKESLISQKFYFCEVQNQTSKYVGVCWNKNRKKWETKLKYKKKQYYGGLFDNEEHAAMKVNLLCDEFETERKNPTIWIKPDIMEQLVIHSLSIKK